MFRTAALIGVIAAALPTVSQAAKVECFFTSVDRFTSKGVWEGRVAEDRWFDWSFQEINLDLDAELLRKLDQKVPFLAGNAGQGDIYVVGTDMGVDGRLITVAKDDGDITIWSGFCEISFG